MFGIEGLELERVLQIVYLLIGLCVAYWHIERHAMKESIRSARIHHAGNLVWYALALIWPVLLFAYAFEPKKKPKEPSDD